MSREGPPAPIAVLDAAYSHYASGVSAVIAADWRDSEPLEVLTEQGPPAEPYESGRFYKRELPLLLSILSQWKAPLSAVVIDGHVWLDGKGRPGLGARLHEALGGDVPVIGLAKSPLAHRADEAEPTEDFGFAPIPVLRGQSQRPLYVSAVGIERAVAVDLVHRMHGDNRLPTLVKIADRAARNALPH